MSNPLPMLRQDITSWGGVDRSAQEYLAIQFRDQIYKVIEGLGSKKYLACGLRRSYSDSCLNRSGVIVDTSKVDRFISFDVERGIIQAEAGVSLSQILKLIVPMGWFLATTPGTRFVTLAGAIANDVHGKNHHAAGAFGCNVKEINIFRSDGGSLLLNAQTNPELLSATIGGLGLTGVIASASISLSRIPSAFLNVETICYNNLEEFWDLCEASQQSHEHTVSWVDCSAERNSLGRGVFSRANWCSDNIYKTHQDNSWKTVPVEAPQFLLNRLSIAAFNELYFRLNSKKTEQTRQHYADYFYPLDSIRHWNRLYGAGGIYQYQCVAPINTARETIAALLKEITRSGQGSFLAVLKTFGNKLSPGLLSFPRLGATLALDFPNRGADTIKLMERLDAIVTEGQGALYPAKDGRMSKALFRQSFPAWQEFTRHIDPGMTSDFWRRVTL